MKVVLLSMPYALCGNLARHVLLGLVAFLFTGQALAADVSLAWDPSASSSSTDFGGYRIYYGETSKTYTSKIDVDKTKTAATITGLTAGRTYFFALKSFNAAKTIESSAFSNEVSKAIPATSTASITATATSGAAPLLVTFSTQAATSYLWNFGDGTTSTAQTASKTFSVAGTYTVTLTTSAGIATPQTITVSAPLAPVANFSATTISGVAPLTVSFTDTSTGNITSKTWNYGDGSTGTSPSHTYNAAGTYSVSLTVTGPGGTNTKTSANLINVTAPVPPPPTASACATTGLVAAYGFEETTGTTARDTSGKNNVGTIREALRIRGGRYGRALRFDGINDFVTVRDSASLDLLGAYTIEAWVKPRAVVRSSILVKEVHPGGTVPAGTVYDLYAYGDGGNLYDSAFDDGTAYRVISGTGPLPINTWSHLVATYDGATQRLYFNGALVKARAQTGQIKQSANPLRIGGNAIWGEYFNGAIDEVRLYNCALTPSEVSVNLAKPVGK